MSKYEDYLRAVLAEKVDVGTSGSFDEKTYSELQDIESFLIERIKQPAKIMRQPIISGSKTGTPQNSITVSAARR